MKLNNFKKFNICLSILIIIDLVLISFTLISRVPINIYYGIIVFDTIVCIVLWNDFFTRLFPIGLDWIKVGVV